MSGKRPYTAHSDKGHCQRIVAVRLVFSIWIHVLSCTLTYFNRDLLHTHTHPFNGPLSGTTQVNRYQKGKTSLDFSEARHSEWQWNQLGHMQVCTSLQTDNNASSPPLSFFTGWMPFLLPNQQHQSTEGATEIC